MRADRCGRGHDLTVPGNVKNRLTVAGYPFRACRPCDRERAAVQNEKRKWARVFAIYQQACRAHGVGEVHRHLRASGVPVGAA